MPSYATILPTVTGHSIPLFSHFIIPHGLFCEGTEKQCTAWVAEEYLDEFPEVTSCDPAELYGVEYCCTNWEYTATEECATRTEQIASYGAIILLIGVYFAIGAWIGKRK